MKLIAITLLLAFLGLTYAEVENKALEEQTKLEIVRAHELPKKRSMIEKVLVAETNNQKEPNHKISKRLFNFIPNGGFGVERIVPVPVAARVVHVPVSVGSTFGGGFGSPVGIVNRVVSPGLGLGLGTGGFANTAGFGGLGNGFGVGLTGGLNGLGGGVSGLSLGGGGIQGLGGQLGAGLDGGFPMGLRRGFFGNRLVDHDAFLDDHRFNRNSGRTIIVVNPSSNKITNNNALGGSSNTNAETRINDDSGDADNDFDDRRRRTFD